MGIVVACYIAGFWEVFRVIIYIAHLFGLGYTVSRFADVVFFKEREFHHAQMDSLKAGICGLSFVLMTGFVFYGIPNGQVLIDILTAL